VRLTSESELATEWGMTPEKVAGLRQKNTWPHVRLSRFDVRYTEEQLAFIVREHSVGTTAKGNVVAVRNGRRAR
jgi:hypothetical protein